MPHTFERGTSEPDVEPDPQIARSRDTGGVPDHPADSTEGDAPGTTGTGDGEEFVGRAAGRDLGYAGETGAEARAEAGEENPS
jgi:hypothetical protein